MAKSAISYQEQQPAPTMLHNLGLRIVEKPIPAPEIIRGGGGGSLYAAILNDAAKLRATSIEVGLAPHFEWPCESRKQLRTRLAGLQGLKRRNRGQWTSIHFMQRINEEEKKFHIYIWNEG